MPGRLVTVDLDSIFANRDFKVGIGTVVLREIVDAKAYDTDEKCADQKVQKTVAI